MAYQRGAAQHVLDLVLVRDPQMRAMSHLFGNPLSPMQMHDVLLSHPFFWDLDRCFAFISLLGNVPDWTNQSLQRAFVTPMTEALQKGLSVPDGSMEWEDVVAQTLGPNFVSRYQGQSPPDDRRLLYVRVGRNFLQHHGSLELEKRTQFLNAAPRVIPVMWQYFTLTSHSLRRWHPELAEFLRWRYVPGIRRHTAIGQLDTDTALNLL